MKFLKYFAFLLLVAAIVFFGFVATYSDKKMNTVTLKVLNPEDQLV
jgi:hypothetical protein